jgi:hypothetical protein
MPVGQASPEALYGNYYRRGQPFFKAICADRPISMAGVVCHNSHDLSTKRDYTRYDVRGGIIISFPSHEAMVSLRSALD